jgi:hypothetical protein
MFDWMISVDDPAIEPPDVWRSRTPAVHLGRGPRFVLPRAYAATHSTNLEQTYAGRLDTMALRAPFWSGQTRQLG